MQTHHTAITLRQMMPQADYKIALGYMMADMETAAKAGETRIVFNEGDYEVDDMEVYYRRGHETTRTGRIVIELRRLGYEATICGPMDNPHLRVTW